MGLKRLSIYIQGTFYIIAGANHFINPEFYYPLIPEYFVFEERINGMAGFYEIVFGIGLFFFVTRKAASYFIIIMLLAFVTSHVHFIQMGSCFDGGLCVPEWVGWFRLVVIHPLLIWWAWSVRNFVSRLSPTKARSSQGYLFTKD